MTYPWAKTVFPIAAIFSFRMLGLFLLIPVFTVYAANLEGATPTLIGIALGSYGLTQGLLQMPFGLFSDRVGRKTMLTIGLVLFVLGSLIGAITHSIYGMIFARIIQGMGAIGSVLIALLADLTPNQQRTKAMAVIGMTIGLSFSLAMVISPALSQQYGLAGIFYFTALLASLGLLLLHGVIPNPQTIPSQSDAQLSLLKPVLHNPQLRRLNIGIFCQHFILTASFFAIPMLLKTQVSQGHLSAQWHFYLPLMFFSFVFMMPFIYLAEKKQWMKPLFLFSVLITFLSQGILAYTHQEWLMLCTFLFIYFISFNFLEASLPSMISKQADPHSKGTAMGVYSTSQFLGLFAGGSLAGVVYQWQGNPGIFLMNALIALIWLFTTSTMKLVAEPR